MRRKPQEIDFDEEAALERARIEALVNTNDVISRATGLVDSPLMCVKSLWDIGCLFRTAGVT